MIQFEGHAATVCSLAFSPDSMTLASGAKDGGVRLWDAAGGLTRSYVPHAGNPRTTLAWHPRCNRTLFADGTALSELSPVPNDLISSSFTARHPLTGIAVVSDTLLAVGTGGPEVNDAGGLALIDLPRCVSRPIPLPIAGSQRIRSIVAHPPTKRLHWIAGLPNTMACIWRSWCITSANATDTKLNKPAADIAVSPDGGIVAIASDWLVRVFAADGKPRTDLSGHKGQVSGVGFINGGRTVVSASWDESVRFWDVATGKETARFPLAVGKLTALAVSPDGTRVAAGGTDGPIVVIDAE